MIFTDDLENIVEPNLMFAQQNLYSPMQNPNAVLTISKESSEDDSTNKRFNLLSILFLFSFPNLLHYCSPVKRRQALLRSNLPRNNRINGNHAFVCTRISRAFPFFSESDSCCRCLQKPPLTTEGRPSLILSAADHSETDTACPIEACAK